MATQMSHVQMPAVHIHDPSQVNVNVQQQTVASGANQGGGELQYKYDVLKQSMPGVSIFLQPVAAPSALGFASFALANWVVATFYANWYGGLETPIYIAPFVLMMGIAQLCAAFWCYPARDATGTVFHGTWGALWTSFGVIYIMTAQRFYPGVQSSVEKFGNNDEWAMWLVTCAAITLLVAIVTVTRDILISSVALLQLVGTVLMFAGFFSNQEGDKVADSIKAAGYFLGFASIVAIIRAAIYCLPQISQDEYTDVISSKKHRGQPRVAIPIGEPGVRRGQ